MACPPLTSDLCSFHVPRRAGRLLRFSRFTPKDGEPGNFTNICVEPEKYSEAAVLYQRSLALFEVSLGHLICIRQPV